MKIKYNSWNIDLGEHNNKRFWVEAERAKEVEILEGLEWVAFHFRFFYSVAPHDGTKNFIDEEIVKCGPDISPETASETAIYKYWGVVMEMVRELNSFANLLVGAVDSEREERMKVLRGK